MSHEAFSTIPIVITMPVLSIASDLVIWPINSGGTITSVACSVATLISGIGVLVGKNNLGTQLFTVSMSAAGMSSGTVNVPSLAPGDALHLGFTGIGVGLTGVVVTIDMKVPSSS